MQAKQFTPPFGKFTVQDSQHALLYRHGKFETLLSPGQHRYSKNKYLIYFYDAREQQCSVQGQEVLSADQVTLKISALITYKIADVVKLHQTSANPYAAFYSEVQIALRELVATEEAETFLQQKSKHGERLLALLSARVKDLGVQAVRADVRDIMLPNAIKKSFMSALQQRQEAQAALEKARAETAALRTLANAARLVRENPELLQLRYLEAIKDIGEKGACQIKLGLPSILSGPTE